MSKSHLGQEIYSQSAEVHAALLGMIENYNKVVQEALKTLSDWEIDNDEFSIIYSQLKNLSEMETVDNVNNNIKSLEFEVESIKRSISVVMEEISKIEENKSNTNAKKIQKKIQKKQRQIKKPTEKLKILESQLKIYQRYFDILPLMQLKEDYKKGNNAALALFVLHSNNTSNPNFVLPLKFMDRFSSTLAHTSQARERFSEISAYAGEIGTSTVNTKIYSHSEQDIMRNIYKNRELFKKETDRLLLDEGVDANDYSITFFVSTHYNTCCICHESIKDFVLKMAECFKIPVNASVSFAQIYETDLVKSARERILKEDNENILQNMVLDIYGAEFGNLEDIQKNAIIDRLIVMGMSFVKAPDSKSKSNSSSKSNISIENITLQQVISALNKLSRDVIKNNLIQTATSCQVQIHEPSKAMLARDFTDGIGDDISDELMLGDHDNKQHSTNSSILDQLSIDLRKGLSVSASESFCSLLGEPMLHYSGNYTQGSKTTPQKKDVAVRSKYTPSTKRKRGALNLDDVDSKTSYIPTNLKNIFSSASVNLNDHSDSHLSLDSKASNKKQKVKSSAATSKTALPSSTSVVPMQSSELNENSNTTPKR